jgi:hypothetical protein
MNSVTRTDDSENAFINTRMLCVSCQNPFPQDRSELYRVFKKSRNPWLTWNLCYLNASFKRDCDLHDRLT